MKILVVSNIYPPQVIGGYELGCRDVVEGLKQRGHQVLVLTSWYGLSGPLVEGEVHRVLSPFRLVGDFYPTRWQYLSVEHEFQSIFRRSFTTFQPDIVYFWNMGGLPCSILYVAEQMTQATQTHTAYYVSDGWPLYISGDSWYERWLSGHKGNSLKSVGVRFLSQIRLMPFYENFKFDNVQFTSNALRAQLAAAGVLFEHEKIISWGVDCDKFSESPSKRTALKSGPVRALYSGQVMPHKGTHTVIKAMALLHETGIGPDKLTLTIVGGSSDASYEHRVKQMVADARLENMVTFAGKKPREETPAIYKAHDIYVFPSVWEEPFSIALVEAMASGMAVVCTTTGGTAEIAVDGQNCLTFAKEDALECSNRIRTLLDNPALLNDLGVQARLCAEKEHNFGLMLTQIETHLQAVVQNMKPLAQGI